MAKSQIFVAGEPVSKPEQLVKQLLKYKGWGFDTVTVTADQAAVPMHVELNQGETWMRDFADKVFASFT